MPKAYSGDLRVRVIEMVRAGASGREAAEVFSVAGSTAVKWLQRWEKSGSAEAKRAAGAVGARSHRRSALPDGQARAPGVTRRRAQGSRPGACRHQFYITPA